MEKVNTNFSYRWDSVLTREGRFYFFPEKITTFMREKYRCPAIYRWDIYRKIPEDEKLIYVGETELLCPRRIYHYLNPGPSQQTNKRLNAVLKDYINKGFKIGLEILQFDTLVVDEFTFTKEDLKDKQLRKLLEDMMIVYYQAKGFTILNL